MNGQDPPSKDQVRAAFRKFFVATLFIYFVLAGLMVYVFVDSANRRADLAKVTVNTTRSLCTLRSDLEQRVEAAEKFLADHPDGIEGISALAIQQSIDNQKQTVDALSNLDCSPDIGGTT